MALTDNMTKGSSMLSLEGYINMMAIYPVLNEISRRARQQRGAHYILESSRVTDFSGEALAEICRLRRNLQEQDSDVVLAQCNDYVCSRMVVPLFESLLAS